MGKLRLTFILSLIILAGAFILAIVYFPSGEEFPEAHRAQVIEAENEWILQYDIFNRYDRDMEYVINITVDDAVYTDRTVVRPGKVYTYIHHVYPQQLSAGRVTFTLYEEDKAEPVDQATYYLKDN